MVSFTTEFAPCKPLRVRHPLSSSAQGWTCRGRGKLYVTLTSGGEAPCKFKCQGLDMQGRKFYVNLTSGSEAPFKFKCQGLDMQGRKLYAVLNSLYQAPSKFCSANIQFCSYLFQLRLMQQNLPKRKGLLKICHRYKLDLNLRFCNSFNSQESSHEYTYSYCFILH